MVDQAGNYIFELDGEKYRIMKMQYREQREFFKNVMKKAFHVNELGETALDLYSDGCDHAQDWLLARIYHKTESRYYPLSDEGLQQYLDFVGEKLNLKPVPAVNELFMAGVDALLENFTSTEKESTQVNSNHHVVEDSEVETSPNLLSKTLP